MAFRFFRPPLPGVDRTILEIERALNGPRALPSYTVAAAPSAAAFRDHAIIITDETGGRTIATSDGTDWLRVSDGAAIS